MDIRKQLSNSKHFISLPLPLFHYLCKLEITQAQERVFMLHWFEGQMRGDWKSELPISSVAKRLSMSSATVKRAYKALGEMGLILRHDQGRCKLNPMRSAVTVTEVTIPDNAIDELMMSPNRQKTLSTNENETNKECEVAIVNNNTFKQDSSPKYESLQDDDEINLFGNHSFNVEHEEPSYHEIYEDVKTNEEVKNKIKHSEEKPKRSITSMILEAFGEQRKLTISFASRVKSELSKLFSGQELERMWHQVLWSIQEGNLAGFHVSKSKNIALKLLRTKRWTEPKNMPCGWKWSPSN